MGLKRNSQQNEVVAELTQTQKAVLVVLFDAAVKWDMPNYLVVNPAIVEKALEVCKAERSDFENLLAHKLLAPMPDDPRDHLITRQGIEVINQERIRVAEKKGQGASGIGLTEGQEKLLGDIIKFYAPGFGFNHETLARHSGNTVRPEDLLALATAGYITSFDKTQIEWFQLPELVEEDAEIVLMLDLQKDREKSGSVSLRMAATGLYVIG